jgi:hypothetical protein
MNMPAPTPAFLAERLSAAPGAKDRFGSTAAEVLETAALVAAAHLDWDKGTIAAFQDQRGIHAKVWGKLVSIAKSKNLQGLPKDDLPASYTALYALEVMTPQELQAAVAEGLLKTKKLSSRLILDWTKAYRLKGTGIEQEIPLTLVLREDLSEQQQQDLLTALGHVAEEFGAEVRQGKGGVRQAEVKAEVRQARAQEIEELLMREIGEVVASAPDDLKSKFHLESALDLISGSREQFTGFFKVLEGKEQEVFWIKYGRAYCLKIVRDFNLTDSRFERSQLKKRIEQAIERWGIERSIPGFKEIAEEIQRTYMVR